MNLTASRMMVLPVSWIYLRFELCKLSSKIPCSVSNHVLLSCPSCCVIYSLIVPSEPLSFDLYAKFVQEFDKLYGQSFMPNPMRSTGETLHDKTTSNIFQHTQFPISFWYNQDISGITTRTPFPSVTGTHHFSIVNKASGKALARQNTSCSTSRIIIETHIPEEVRQQFYLSTNENFLVPRGSDSYKVAFRNPSSGGDTRLNCMDGRVLEINNYPSNSLVEGRSFAAFKIDTEGQIISGEYFLIWYPHAFMYYRSH